MRQVVQEWCATAVARLEIHGCIVWRALLPTPREDADPWKGHGAPGRLVRLALAALLLGVDLGPEGMSGGCRRPLHTRLAQQLGTLETPVDPGLRAAAFRHWRHTRLFLECAEGDEEAGSKNGPSPWEGVKQREVGMVLSALGEGGVEV